VSEAWNAGDVPLLVAHPESAKYGLNLQKGGHIVVWLTLTWSAESYAQSNARLARQGQSRPVQIVRLIERESVDERKRDVLAGRAALESAVMEELKR
jgi:SNF2 family DNA or RNA helicase